ncbi:MAG: aminotransferase class I/II-fold pyridoxal phosphate-dependent enzyme [Ignavibacteria bacterium]|nr:aminotransferase class I/II-fold pyridoxal phosphate-dependent enzyme [Ignavibacteria bacterium]
MIDLRSDTITMPSPGMRKAIAAAEVGDDVFSEDPTVNRLEKTVADMLSAEAALFVPSGSMGNQICVKIHTQPGDEVVLEEGSHVYNNETAGMAFLSSVQVVPVAGKNGALTVEDIRKVIRPDVYYMPRTRLVCLENTHNRAGGTIVPLEVVRSISSFAKSENLALHLDGARLWNAVVASEWTGAEYCRHFDSVSVCFSKGLGAPVGSAIVGSSPLIAEARHYRKLFGGGMRQAGILAAAALYALKNNIDRLAEDHEKAKTLARDLAGVEELSIDEATVQTNIVRINISGTGRTVDEMLELIEKNGVRLTRGGYDSVRAVTHMDVEMREIRQAATIIKDTVRHGS